MTTPDTKALVERARAAAKIRGLHPTDKELFLALADALEKALSQPSPAPPFHHHNRHPLASPGDRPERLWIMRFDDPDMREMQWSGPDAEAEARAAYAQYSPTWNVVLLATVEASPVQGEALSRLVSAALAVCDRWDSPNWSDARHTRDFIDELRAAAALAPTVQGEAVASEWFRSGDIVYSLYETGRRRGVAVEANRITIRVNYDSRSDGAAEEAADILERLPMLLASPARGEG